MFLFCIGNDRYQCKNCMLVEWNKSSEYEIDSGSYCSDDNLLLRKLWFIKHDWLKYSTKLIKHLTRMAILLAMYIMDFQHTNNIQFDRHRYGWLMISKLYIEHERKGWNSINWLKPRLLSTMIGKLYIWNRISELIFF